MESKEREFKEMSQAIMKTYHEQMHAYLNSKPDGGLTDADVIIMIMNLTIGVSTNIYYSLKQILPTTTMDFDFMRAKLSNSLVDSFEKIKDYNPKEQMMPLTVDQVKEIRAQGFTHVTMPDGTTRKVTEDEILVKREDADKLLAEAKKETVNAQNTPKIIVPNNFVLPREQSESKAVV